MSFSENFLWGAASAAYQVEGAYDADGKGPGIWDALSEGHVQHGENGNVACDHYHRFREDVAIMKEMGLKAYRFSVSWPRVMPEPGKVNDQGLQFYRDLVSELRQAGIEPMCTLFHWNLPMWAHEQGGWGWEGISDAFADYVKVVMEALSGQVSWWMTLNEPACFIGLGYMTGEHAPFERVLGLPEAEQQTRLNALTRNVLLAHGKAVQVIRKYAVLPPKVGMALNGSLYTAESAEKDAAWAEAQTFPTDPGVFTVNWWADPAILGVLPKALEGTISQEELAVIHQKLDFFGYNSYHSCNCDKSAPTGMPRTAMGWPITPDALYWAAKLFTSRYGLPLLITENGMANLDFVMSDGKVHDPQRIEYLRRYLTGLRKAVEEQVPIIGYLYWSILDNFEWAEGYDKRFGLVYVDYETQKRTRKDSSYWYAKLIAENRIPLLEEFTL